MRELLDRLQRRLSSFISRVLKLETKVDKLETTVENLPSGGGGSASLSNSEVFKGYAKFPPLQARTVSVNGTAISPSNLYFSAVEPLQIYQDTQIQTVKGFIHTGSAADSLYMALYKYDFENDKMVKVESAEWSILAPNLSASQAGYTVSLGSPITIGPGTYYMAMIPTGTGVRFEGFSMLSGSALIDFYMYTGDVSINNTATNGTRIHLFRTDAGQITITPTALPAEIPMSQMQLIYFNTWVKMPNLIY
jgi:hypothetical protein